jgi:hypothetical protein
MINEDCKYYLSSLRPINEPHEPREFKIQSKCRLFHILIDECPEHCIHDYNNEEYPMSRLLSMR